MKNHYEIGSVVFGKWSIARRIGAGSFGTVYEIQAGGIRSELYQPR